MAERETIDRPRGTRRMVPGISLANKSQLLFGLSAAIILSVALAVPWVRSSVTVAAFQEAEVRQLATAWLSGRTAIQARDVEVGDFPPRTAPATSPVRIAVVPLGPPAPAPSPSADDGSGGDGPRPDADGDAAGDTGSSTDGDGSDAAGTAEAAETAEDEAARAQLRSDLTLDSTDRAAGFITEARTFFMERPDADEYRRRYRHDGSPVDRYARALRVDDLREITSLPPTIRLAPRRLDAATEASPDASGAPIAPGGSAPASGDESGDGAPSPRAPIVAMLVVDRDASIAEAQLLQSRIFVLATGTVGILLNILLFYFILTKLILSPVRKLRETVETVREGDWSSRSEIRTGDEFEQLSDAFNEMLDRLERGRSELEQLNRSLDLKVDQLAEANVGLDESNRLKSEFVASVSHELRTPLNSIIGFAELLQELARTDPEADPKRGRYLENIVTSSRKLLEMINELLDMAKIEAGRMEVTIEPTSVVDVIEGLVRILAPQADQKSLNIVVEVGSRIPVVETDAGKLQQILYNFLSNAIKFTPDEGRITIGARRLVRHAGKPMVRLSVADTGPGIPEDMHDIVFEKFRQIDASHTREHAGTGLGLAICRNLAEMLGAEVSFSSEPGQGATFFVDLPAAYRPDEPQPLMGGLPDGG